MRGMHITHFKTGAFTGQATRAQRGNTTLVGDFRKRVVLVHKLRQLAGAKKFLDGSSDRLGIDQFLRHQAFRLRDTEAFFHGTLHAHQADAEYVLRHLADTANPPVTEVIDIIDKTVAITNLDQDLHNFQYVFFRQRT